MTSWLSQLPRLNVAWQSELRCVCRGGVGGGGWGGHSVPLTSQKYTHPKLLFYVWYATPKVVNVS